MPEGEDQLFDVNIQATSNSIYVRASLAIPYCHPSNLRQSAGITSLNRVGLDFGLFFPLSFDLITQLMWPRETLEKTLAKYPSLEPALTAAIGTDLARKVVETGKISVVSRNGTESAQQYIKQSIGAHSLKSMRLSSPRILNTAPPPLRGQSTRKKSDFNDVEVEMELETHVDQTNADTIVPNRKHKRATRRSMAPADTPQPVDATVPPDTI